jgi:hypothetical protein
VSDAATFWLLWGVPCLLLTGGAAYLREWDFFVVGVAGLAFVTLLALISWWAS